MSVAVSFDKTRPIYLQIMETIKRPVLRGELGPGTPLQSVRDLARQLGVNPNTIARAFSELEREGFITTKRGTGAFVTQDPKRIAAERDETVTRAAQRFVDEITDLGLSNHGVDRLLQRMRSRPRRHGPRAVIERKRARSSDD